MVRKVLPVAVVLLCVSLSSALADEIVFIPKCRLLDTRNIPTTGTGSPISAGSYYDIAVKGTPGGTQGGESGCGVPEEATGAFISIVAVSPSGSGYIRLFGWGETEPLPPTLTVISGDTRNDGVLESFPATGAYQWTAHVVGTTSHLVIDLIGYTTIKPTTWVKGLVASKTYPGNTLNIFPPPIVQLELDSLFFGLEVICEEPFINPEDCDQLEPGGEACGIGHIGEFDGSPAIIAHIMNDCLDH